MAVHVVPVVIRYHRRIRCHRCHSISLCNDNIQSISRMMSWSPWHVEPDPRVTKYPRNSLSRILIVIKMHVRVADDHSLIITIVELQLAVSLVSATFTRHQWAKFDCDAFREDLIESTLLISPPTDWWEFFLCYDETFHQLLDEHASFRKYIWRSRILAPWFNTVARPWSKQGDWRRTVDHRARRSHIVNGESSPMFNDRSFRQPTVTSGPLKSAAALIQSHFGVR